MKNFCYIILSLLFSVTLLFAGQHGRCGTQSLWEHQQAIRQGLAARTSSVTSTSCEAEAFYDTTLVQEKITSHFRIYYVLEGPHATTISFADTVAAYLEKAWTFHTRTLGMRAPKGADTSYHFRRSDRNDLYPVEIIDIDMIRNGEDLLGGYCGGCYGISFPPNNTKDYQATELVIDNDFRYSTESTPRDSVTYNGKVCHYPVANMELSNTSTGHSYIDYFNEGIAVTVFHELYHAVQARYLNYYEYSNYNYWLEASAVGVEEIGSPTVNDYWAYLNYFFQSPGTVFSSLSSPYGVSAWYLYNYHQWGPLFDAALWSRIEKNPDSTFDVIYAEELQKREVNPDSIFHDFSENLFFSGNRAQYLTSPEQIAEDQPFWPEMKLKNPNTEVTSLYPTAFNYYRLTGNSLPSFSADFKGSASVALWNTDSDTATFIQLESPFSLTSLNTVITKADSAVLILSRLRTDVSTGANTSDSLPMRAYPNPWQGNSPLCFTALPQGKDYIEVWTRSLKRAFRKSYEGTSLCLEANSIRQFLTPGLYHFRAGNRGKTKPFLVIY
jgi:hypothetical protein